MSWPVIRWLFAAAMCVAVLGLTVPSRAAAKLPAQQTMNCCANTADQQQPHQCKHDTPPPADDDHCCAACAIGLSLFLSPPAHFIFSERSGETLIATGITEASRFERPPVPPPRAKLG